MQNRNNAISIMEGYKKDDDKFINKVVEDVVLLIEHFFTDQDTICQHVAFFKSLNSILGKVIEQKSETDPLSFALMALQRSIYLDLIKSSDTVTLSKIYESMQNRKLENRRIKGVSATIAELRQQAKQSREYPIMHWLADIYAKNVREENGTLFNEFHDYIKRLRQDALQSNKEEFVDSVNSLIERYNQLDEINNRNRYFFESAKPIAKISLSQNSVFSPSHRGGDQDL